MGQDSAWWRTTTIYQVYPRSFADANGDGIGDIRGVIGRLDHLVDLGVGAIWLSPFFESPQRDVGYDVSSYRDVAPEYGTLDDARELIEAAHAGGLRLAIATTTSAVNIVALLRRAIGPDWQRFFTVVEDASTAPRKKPDPMVYQQTLARLALPAAACLAFEDSANGLMAARTAKLATIVTPNDFTAHHDFTCAGLVRCATPDSGSTLGRPEQLEFRS